MGDLDRILHIVSELRRRLIRIAIVLVPIFAFTITFQLRPFDLQLGGVSIPFAYPYPNFFYNVTAQVFQAMRGLLPPGVQLLNLKVGDSVMVQVEIGALLTLIVGMPWIAHEVGAFLVPALRQNERQLLRQIGIPATILFVIGTAIGLLVFTPFTYRFLFLYVNALGLVPVLGVQDFVTFTLLYTLAFGVVFELPVFIYALTRLGVVQAKTWRKHWRGAVIGALVFGMVVTPDNSGVTMLLVASPMIALYFGGAFFAGRWERHKEPNAPRGALPG
ncbi:MAG TPA: twin-arginine translocase subunit TatC [Thermoplasmata archaeon]|nr:twin-arginine translocase subunit TatC [Thermoplasmata archaeon]